MSLFFPMVSVIIPVLNDEVMLARCLNSLTAVDWPKESLEIIVVDNGSTDNTPKVARTHGASVLQDPDATVAGLRNLGVLHAKGEILAFVDSDCTVGRDWLRSASPYFDDKTIVAWGAPPEVPENATWVQRAWYLLRMKENDIQDVDWLESMNLFVRKTAFDSIQGFDANLVTCEDVDLCYRVSPLGRIVADRSIRMIHWGEAATLRRFIQKERWRGQDSFKGGIAHGLSFKELPSLGIPLYMVCFLPVMVVIALLTGVWGKVCLAGAVLLPGLMVLLKIRAKKAGTSAKLQLALLSYVYFFARTLSVLPGCKR